MGMPLSWSQLFNTSVGSTSPPQTHVHATTSSSVTRWRLRRLAKQCACRCARRRAPRRMRASPPPGRRGGEDKACGHVSPAFRSREDLSGTTCPGGRQARRWTRDEGRCAFAGAEGRCPETGFLEFHHVVPFAAGGATTIENLQLRCRSHNAHEAELFFGSPALSGQSSREPVPRQVVPAARPDSAS